MSELFDIKRYRVDIVLKLAFTPRWIASLLLVIALSTGFVLLSHWQLSSATWGQRTADPAKEIVQPWEKFLSAHEPLTIENSDHMVKVTGHYIAGSSYLVTDKLNEGRQGYWVVSAFLPETTPATDSEPRALAIARAWTAKDSLPAEPQGTLTVIGRIVSNDAPYYSRDIEQKYSAEQITSQRMIGTAASAQLTNLWDIPLYGAIITADAETPQGTPLPLDAEGKLLSSATIVGQTGDLHGVRASQVTHEDVNWLNIFYALEWLVFAGFAFFLWWRMLKDSYEKAQDPAEYFEYEGQYWLDEDSGRYYYWDPAEEQYYFFDDISQQQILEERTNKHASS
ncbi:SURF1 family protein [Rothia sp. P7181]|uniref:SURF1 family protein n=1 Tax=unclassified Rothia (in: high G+C Gram-positive bacteria) TaxID=2689056 RepID=UPI003AC7B976